MRLTLRTLLAYVDDTLPPDQAREIGQKVAESHVAQELMERIKKVTRRRGLTVPPAAGPERIDANTVAEYLDNDLPADRVAEVEEMALNSDVHLAEIAACHQILTLVLGEPAHVPPTARERMYGLVQGAESEPHRRASRIGPPAFPGETESADDLKAARRGLGYRLLGACVLGVALAVAVWQAVPRRQPAPNAAPGDGTADSGAQPDTEPTPAPMPEPKPPEPNPKPPVPDPKPPVPDPKPPVPDKVTPPVPPPTADKPPDRAPSTDRKLVGQFTSKDAVLLTRDGNDWTKVAPDAKVGSVAPILALPGSHVELKLDSGARLTLWGGLPETTGWKTLDCQVTLHAAPTGYDLDFTLDHGRVYLATIKKPDPTKVRVRFADQIWDLTLPDDQAEVMIDVTRLFAGEPLPKDGKGEAPRTDVTLAVVQGQAHVKADTKDFDLKAPPGPAELHWDNKGLGVSKPIELDAAPAAWAKVPAKLPRDRQLEIEAAQKKLVQRVGEKDKAINLALAEVAQDANRASKVLGVLGQGAIGQTGQVLDALEEPQFPEARAAAAAALVHFSARQPDADQKVFDLLQSRKGYTLLQAGQAVWLLHGFSDAQLSDPNIFERLIDALRSDQTAVRELAAWRLRQIDPEGAALIRFSATDPEPAREKAVGDWLRRIPPGKLPPGRGNPQGRAPQKAPTRGSAAG
jgi:hypothetical protein